MKGNRYSLLLDSFIDIPPPCFHTNVHFLPFSFSSSTLSNSSYGAFWLSYAVILIPGFGVVAGYANAPDHTLDNALGIFLLAWGIFTFIMWIATFRSTVTMSSMFFILVLTFFFLSSAHLSHLPAGNIVTRIGGGLGLVTALLAWYNAASGLYNSTSTFVRLPTGSLAHAHSD